MLSLQVLFSCRKDLLLENDAEEIGQIDESNLEGLVLKLEPSGMDLSTRTFGRNTDSLRRGDFDGAFNENKLGSVDVFFFRSGADYDTKSIFNRKVSVSANGYVQMPVSAGDVFTIFGSNNVGAEALVFVVVNYNGKTGIDHNNHYTVNELRNLSLAVATWKTNLPKNNPNFVMISDNNDKDNPSVLVPIKLTAPNSSTPASGTVRLKRVAAKVTFRLTVADSIKVVNVIRDQSGNVIDRKLETWKPDVRAMTAYLQYAFKVGTLGGDPQTPPAVVPLTTVPDDHPTLFVYNERKLAVKPGETISRTRVPVTGLTDGLTDDDPPQPVYGDPVTKEFPVYQVVSDASGTAGPFYTYPVTWDPGVAGEPFIKLIIPWNNGSRSKKYYYKIPFKSAPLESNHWYEITLDVQILGGEDTNPVPLEATYKVVDWVPGASTSAAVNDARYLSVPKTEWIMYNTNELTIPITSSHDVEIVGYKVKSKGTAKDNAFAEKDKYDDNRNPLSDTWIGGDPRIYNPFTNTLTSTSEINATKPNYKANTSGDPYPSNFDATDWFPEITRDHIVFRHALNNDTNSKGTDGKANYDVAPYYIRIRVQHKDDPTYYKDIIIEQRPAIVIEAQKNSYPYNDYKGYAWVNNSSVYREYTGNNSSYRHYYRESYGYYYDDYYYDYYLGGDPQNRNATMNNTNWNMYLIETSVLPTTGALKDYMLSDPRSSSVDNLNSDLPSVWSANAPFVEGGSHSLTNYYPVNKSSVANDYISPKYRIASSYGACRPLLYEDAFRRCASYQEDGYPAGRWRVPTKAELMYMAQLTADGMIPRLLGSDNTNPAYSYYWCNGGYVKITNGSTIPPEFQPNTSVSTPIQHPDYYNIDGSESGIKNVRCVYDEWFWENTSHARLSTANKNTFTWGDQTRESVVRTKAAE